MSGFPELLGFKDLPKEVTAKEAASFIEKMQKESLEACSEEKKDLLEKMAESLRSLANGGTGALVSQSEEEGGSSSSKRIVFADDDDEEDEKMENGEKEEIQNENSDSESDAGSDSD